MRFKKKEKKEKHKTNLRGAGGINYLGYLMNAGKCTIRLIKEHLCKYITFQPSLALLVVL